MSKARSPVRPGRIPTLISLGAAVSLTVACSGTDQEKAPSTPATPAGSPTAAPADRELPGLDGGYTKQDVLDMYEKDGGELRLELPVSLPEGYEFVGFPAPHVRETRHGDQIIARKAWFRLINENATVCAELVRAHAEACPETNIDVKSTRKGVLRQVSVEIPVSNDTHDWGDVEYSDDPADWTWLP